MTDVQKLSDVPVEMLETVLMRTFMMLYVSDFEADDDRFPYTSGKSRSAERRAYTMLAPVCWYWRQTLTGWPQSPTSQRVRHRMKQLIERKCANFIFQEKTLV